MKGMLQGTPLHEAPAAEDAITIGDESIEYRDASKSFAKAAHLNKKTVKAVKKPLEDADKVSTPAT